MGNELTEFEAKELAQVQTAPLAIELQRAEIDTQISTARAYPRQLALVARNVHSLVTLDEESAEECMYALPRGGKPIKGPSARFAEALLQSYGNCRSAARVIKIDRKEKVIVAEGMFHDLETNTMTTATVNRRISGRGGNIFNDDMIVVTGNAACSIAKRNAILAGIPKPIWRKAYEAVESTIAGDVTTLAENRDRAMKAMAMHGLTAEQVCEILGKEGLEDIAVNDIPTLRGMFQALKSGETTKEELRRTASKTVEPPADPLKALRTRKAESSQEGLSSATNGMDQELREAKGQDTHFGQAEGGEAACPPTEETRGTGDDPLSEGATGIWNQLDSEDRKSLDEDSKAILKDLMEDLAKVSNSKAAKNALTGHQKSIRAIGEQSFIELCQAAVSIRCAQLEGGK